MIDDLREADETAKGEYRTLKGELTVTAPTGFGRQHLQAMLIDFMREFPEITMRVLLVDRLVDLLDEHVDVAVRTLCCANRKRHRRPSTGAPEAAATYR